MVNGVLFWRNLVQNLSVKNVGRSFPNGWDNAILGTLGKGSIGEHFPAKDPKNYNADSKVFLKYCQKLLDRSNVDILNIDTTIVCESPNISSFSKDMKKSIAACLEISEAMINIKAKTTEGMGFEGGGSISAYSIVSIKLN